MDAAELEERIGEFLVWDYEFEFDNGVTTPVFDRRQINAQEQRRRYMFDPLVRLLGGSLRGARVLDLGCGAGFWSLAAIEAGADYVLGIDAKDIPIQQAKLVFEVKGVANERFDFEHRNIFAGDPLGSFDVAFCLALMQQIAKPVELFELIAGVGAELILIETDTVHGASSSFRLHTPLVERRKPVDHRIVLVPTRSAVPALAAEFGYAAVPLALDIDDYAGLMEYRRRGRLAFLCSNRRSLDGVAVERPSATRWWAPALNRARELKRPRS